MYNHYVKSLRIQSFLCPYFSAFGLSTERYSVFLDIQSKCRKVWTRKIPNTDTFRTVLFLFFIRVINLSVFFNFFFHIIPPNSQAEFFHWQKQRKLNQGIYAVCVFISAMIFDVLGFSSLLWPFGWWWRSRMVYKPCEKCYIYWNEDRF